MKINKMSSSSLPVPSDHEVGSRAEEKVARQFASELQQTQDGQYRERMNALLQQITKQGAKLGQIPTYSELKTYRELVRSFVGEAVGRMYTLQSQPGWDRQGRQKMYTIVKKVDDYLAELTEDVRHGQDRQLQIAEKQDAVRGLLVDLYT